MTLLDDTLAIIEGVHRLRRENAALRAERDSLRKALEATLHEFNLLASHVADIRQIEIEAYANDVKFEGAP